MLEGRGDFRTGCLNGFPKPCRFCTDDIELFLVLSEVLIQLRSFILTESDLIVSDALGFLHFCQFTLDQHRVLHGSGDLAANFTERVLVIVERADKDWRDDFDDVLLTKVVGGGRIEHDSVPLLEGNLGTIFAPLEPSIDGASAQIVETTLGGGALFLSIDLDGVVFKKLDLHIDLLGRGPLGWAGSVVEVRLQNTGLNRVFDTQTGRFGCRKCRIDREQIGDLVQVHPSEDRGVLGLGSLGCEGIVGIERHELVDRPRRKPPRTDGCDLLGGQYARGLDLDHSCIDFRDDKLAKVNRWQ